MNGLTRRAVLLAGSGAVWPAFARSRIVVDVSPLRRAGDSTDADYLARVLPGYLAEYFGPGHDVSVRIDSVTYGPPGSNGTSSDGAVDWIEGVGVVDGRSIPLTCSNVTSVSFPDPTGYAAHQRQDDLARAFAHWLPRQAAW